MSGINQLLSDAAAKFQDAGIQNAKLDARLLLQKAADLTHAQIIANPDQTLSDNQISAFEQMQEKRLARMPIGRILGTAEFYGRPFELNAATLQPRADTELLIDIAKELFTETSEPISFVDVGTGSGAIALTLALELAALELEVANALAIDLSATALVKAKENAQTLKVSNVEFCHGNCLDPLNVPPHNVHSFDLIISNPPYIASIQIDDLEPEVRDFDPLLALDGGLDGLTFYREIAMGAGNFLKQGGYLLFEIGFDQLAALEKIIDEVPDLEFVSSHKDLAGHARAILARKA